MTSPQYRRMVADLAEAGRVLVVVTGTTRTVTVFDQSPATFPKATYVDLGGRNFRANPTRQTITFDVTVDDIAAVSAHPVVARMVEALKGRVDAVEWSDE